MSDCEHEYQPCRGWKFCPLCGKPCPSEICECKTKKPGEVYEVERKGKEFYCVFCKEKVSPVSEKKKLWEKLMTSVKEAAPSCWTLSKGEGTIPPLEFPLPWQKAANTALDAVMEVIDAAPVKANRYDIYLDRHRLKQELNELR